MVNQSDSQKIVERCYLNILCRKPDEAGLKHYTKLLEGNEIDETGLIQQFKNSNEYKLSHPTDLDPKQITAQERMRTDWNARVIDDVKFAIRSVSSQSEKEFWDSGVIDCEAILGVNTTRNDLIIQGNDPKNMNILEIGCGIGRLIIPMSKIFGEVIGVDVSDEMVKLAKEKTSNITNCKIFQNSGSDISFLKDNYIDFCYSFIVFQHIPDKIIVENYIREVSRVLKPQGIFRFQVRGNTENKPTELTTWDGVSFSSKEIHNYAKENNFKILEEGDASEYFWVTFQLKE